MESDYEKGIQSFQGEAGQSPPQYHFPLGINDQHDENEA